MTEGMRSKDASGAVEAEEQRSRDSTETEGYRNLQSEVILYTVDYQRHY